MKVKNQNQLIDVQLRFLYEDTLGKEIRHNLWNSIKSMLKQSGLIINDDNVKMLATIHKHSPRAIRHQANINLIADINRVTTIEKSTGKEIRSFVIALVYSRQNVEPSDATVYRWFKNTKPGGYKGVGKIYDKFDFCLVCIAAINYKPKK